MTLPLSSQTASITRIGARTTRTRLVTRLICCFVLTTLGVLLAPKLLRAELADDYLAGLRERGWHDSVLDYLSEAENDPLASPAFLAKLGYERAVTQTALSRLSTSSKDREALLDQAAAQFQSFANEHPESPLQLRALSNAGNLFTQLALSANNKSAKLPQAASRQREQLNKSARDYLDKAKTPLQKLLVEAKAKLKALPKATELQKSSQPRASRQQLEGSQAEARLYLAKIDLEKARTYSVGSKARRLNLQSASEAFAKLYKDYEDKLIGFYGRFYQGRSNQELGEFDEALKCYSDIVDQPPIPNQDFRRLVARAFRHRAECYLVRRNFDTAIKECNEWLNNSRESEITQPEWLAVSYQLAKVYDAQAAQANNGDKKRLRNEARKLYREIAKSPGEFQREAKAMLAAAGSPRFNSGAADSFNAAFSAGKDAFERMNSAKSAARIAKENNPSAVESLTTQAIADQAAAIQYFQQANLLADNQTDPEELAATRYFLCWLYWQERRLDEAAVMGSFLAQRYPETKHAANAANIALAAYEQLYRSSKKAKEPHDFEAKRLVEMAELLVSRWPDSSEAAAALNLLINIALRDDRLPEAEKMLQRLPASSRAGAEMRLGGAFWTRYLKASANDKSGNEADTSSLKQKAGQLLTNGFEALESKPSIGANEASGVLYLIQYLLANGQADKAVAALENSNIGPLSLIERKSKAANHPAFVQEAYKVGLRVYVSAEPPQREKAQQMMGALESAVGKQGKASQQLINIYVNLGLQLQQQIRALTAAGQTDKARAVAQSFADLLTRVTQRSGTADSWKIQSWIAQTNLQLGQGLSGDDADNYYRQAEQAYRTLLTKAEADPKFAPSVLSLLITKKNFANCLLSQQEYAEAFKLYVQILKSNPKSPELQKLAATALQQWGVEQKDAKRIEESIFGAMPQANKKNLVWGWVRLAKLVDQAKRNAIKKAGGQNANKGPDTTGRVAKYQSLFFEARYHVAEARFEAAKLATGAKRTAQLGKARQSLQSMKRLYPELGGPQWKKAYLDLLKEMEQTK